MKLIAQLILLVGFIIFIGPVAILGFIALWVLMALAGWDDSSDKKH